MKKLHIYSMYVFCLSCCLFMLTACGSADSSTDSGREASESGQGGSMARFAVSGDYLYTLDNPYINKFDVSDLAGRGFRHVGEGTMESYVTGQTIFVRDSFLYVGTTSGMYIFTLKYLQNVSNVSHFYACDPVVVVDTLAFVTLNGANQCRWSSQRSELQVYSVQDPKNPRLLETYHYDIVSPQGLAIRDTLLFLCDEGLKVFDARIPALQLPLLAHIAEVNGAALDGYDVILRDGGTLILIGGTGLFQYSYQLLPTDSDKEGEGLDIKMALLSSIVPHKKE
jgi:hypothetical protein